MADYTSDLRVRTGRFCQFNCFQEAVLPVLEQHFGCDPRAFEIHRMITWREIGDALRDGRSPGSFGGLHWEALTQLHSITWREAPAQAPARERIEYLAEGGVPICRVDRFHVSADRGWFGRRHSPHAILVVGVDSAGIAYSDADNVHTPARISWPELEVALVRDERGQIEFARAVADCEDLSFERLTRLEADYLRKLDTTLDVPADEVGEIFDLLAVRLSALRPDDPDALVVGIELAAFLNAVAKSLLGAAALTERRGVSEPVHTALRRWGRGVDLCVTRALTFAETRRLRHLERFRESATSVTSAWGADERKWVREGLAVMRS